jgi:signal peptidase I
MRARKVVEWLAVLTAAGLVILGIEAEIAQPFRVPTSSMEPTLACAKPGRGCTGSFDDRVLVARIVYRFRGPQRGEIAVFHAPAAAARLCSEGGTYLKRVIGLPGDVVSERDGHVYVNGRPLREPYVDPSERDTLTRAWPRLGPGRYFVLGDNRVSSCDSRTWGSVPRSAFIGPVVATYWPPTHWGAP